MGLANQLGQFMYGNISLDNNSQLANVKKVDVPPGGQSPIYDNQRSLPYSFSKRELFQLIGPHQCGAQIAG